MPAAKKSKVRVRFAPSPTGFLHLGGLRTALFNYLFAKHSAGQMIVRLEDTDRLRLVEEAEDHIFASLEWLGIKPDESDRDGGEHGPYVQSKRLDLYRQRADELIAKGLAYRDYATSAQLEQLRAKAKQQKEPFRFTKQLAVLDGKGDHAIRFHVAPGQQIGWDDAVFGRQSWQRDEVEDFIAIKSDGFPTYNFANVVDDHEMQISHVLRGEEFLASTPKHLLVYEAFGWQPPVFAHLPAVLGADKAKLSKRHGAKSALEYQDEGYLPEAVINYLASLGWNEGDGSTQEIYSTDELIKKFSLDRIQSSPAVFDPARLEWMNGVYIRQLSLTELYKRCESFWPKEASRANEAYKKKVLGLVQERLKFLSELPELTDFFFADPPANKEMAEKLRKLSSDAESTMNEVTVWLEKTEFTEKELEKRLRALAANGNYKTGTLFGLIRVTVTGRTAAPGLFETLATLGRETSLRRLHAAIDALLQT